MPKVLKKSNTRKNRQTNNRKNNKSKKHNKSKKNTIGGLRLSVPNMDCGPSFHPQWITQQGGHKWREHVRKVMKKHPQEKFGKVLAIAKKTYKKTVNVRENKKNKKSQRKK